MDGDNNYTQLVYNNNTALQIIIDAFCLLPRVLFLLRKKQYYSK
jgi:hypothetical protein